MPPEVVDVFGYALHLSQHGGKHSQAKPLRGFGSAGVLEIIEDGAGSIPTVQFIPSGWAKRSMSCIVSRRNHTRA